MATKRIDNSLPEHQEQCFLIEWFDLQAKARGYNPSLLFAIPNGGKRDAIVGKRMKDEGVRRGIPDLFLAIPTDNFHGLFIELKRTNGARASKFQKEMIEELSQWGYPAVVCHGWIEARDAICDYLGWDKETNRV